jgi:lipopolysaccharide/colanic/teichoic acid biosynthesis glycosyltransferase
MATNAASLESGSRPVSLGTLAAGESLHTAGVAVSRHRPGIIPLLLGSFLSGGLVVSLTLPAWLCYSGIMMSRQDETVVRVTSILSLVAIVAALTLLRRILSYPLLRSSTYVVLTFATIYILLAILFRFLQVNFSSPQFFLSALIAGLSFETFLLFRRFCTVSRFALLPGVDCEGPLPTRSEFDRLVSPPAEGERYSGFIADLGVALSPEWERTLTVAALSGVPVFDVADFQEIQSGRVTISRLHQCALFSHSPSLLYPQVKRVIDVVVSLAVLPLVGIVFAFAAAAIRIDSPGPVLFRQRRVGQGGRIFTIYKLRSMAHEQDIGAHAYTETFDPRVTRVGATLRRYRIDELPQIVNILRGEMSWIGPRPEAVSLAESYEREIPFYAYRHLVRPGLSGWAQVHQGNVGQSEAARLKLEYDFFYIKHFSFWLDAVVAVKTVRTILTGFGAR